jgi:hypothetical protein
VRLTRNVPGTNGVRVFLDGVEQKICFAADDVLGIALVEVLQNGKDIPAPFHCDWKPGEFDHEGVVVRWRTGRVTFEFDPPEKGILAQSCWHSFIAHDALWALGELIALDAGSAAPEYFEGR